jgi:heme exporter protein B
MSITLDSNMFIQQVLALLTKDLKAEWRTREIFTSMFVFAVLVVVVFNFAIGANPEIIRQVAPGVLWVSLLFATVLGLQRAVHMESEEDCLQGVLLAMGDRSALFVAKTIANMVYLLIVAACTLPLFSIWFRIDIASHFIQLGVILLLGMLGFSAVGTLFSILTLNMRAREVMLPLLFLPVSVPLTIGSVYATAKLIEGKRLAEIADYLTLMGVFDVVFVVVALLIFDYIVEE